MSKRDLIESLEELISENEKLKQENKMLKIELNAANVRVEITRDLIKDHQSFLESKIPTRVYRHKKRGNTTVVFKDGSSETVHLKQGEEDCLETAIIYALVKHSYKKSEIEKLMKSHVKEVGE